MAGSSGAFKPKECICHHGQEKILNKNMPMVADNQLDWRTGLQLGLLLMALPAQYLIMNYSSVSQHQSQKALKDLMDKAHQVGADLLSWPAWQKWCIGVFSGIYKEKGTSQNGYRLWTPKSRIAPNDRFGESPAIEVMKHEDPSGHFANSVVVRSPRPPNGQFRIGQVVTHKKFGYRGVIVGWDAHAKAPERWLIVNHPKNRDTNVANPNYAILVDTRDRSEAQITYVAQDNIQLAAKTRIMHPAVKDYFDKYDGRQYIARPALKELYPDD